MPTFDDFRLWGRYFPAPIRTSWDEFIDLLKETGETVTAPYSFSTSLDVVNPGVPNVTLNNADVTLATAVGVSNVDRNGSSFSGVLARLRVNDIVIIRSEVDDDYVVYNMTGDAIPHPASYELPVSYDTHDGGFANGEDIILTAIFYSANTFLELPDTPSSYASQARKMVSVNDAEDALEFDLEPMTWKDQWVATAYKKNDVVLDGAWLMVANKDTADRAAPIPLGDPEWLLPTAPVWEAQNYVGTVWTGLRVTNVPGLFVISSIRVWIPDLSSTYTYRVFSEDNTTGQLSHILTFNGDDLPQVGWYEITIPTFFVDDTADLVFWLSTVNSASSSSFQWKWIRASNSQQDTDPGAGNWNRDNQSTRFRINDNDVTLTDRSTDLDTVEVGSYITITSTVDPSQWLKYQINSVSDNGGWRQYGITFIEVGPGGEMGAGVECDLLFEIPTPSGADYVRIVDEYIADPAVSGQIAFDSGAPVDNQNAYGIDVQYQEYIASPDWDLMAFSATEAVGGGGGGGATLFTDLTDTPANYVGDSEKVVRVTTAEDGLEFVVNAFLILADTPSTYAGNEGAVTVVNQVPDALTFQDINEFTGIINAGPGSAIDIQAAIVPGALKQYTLTVLNQDAVWNAEALQGFPVGTDLPAQDDVLSWQGTSWEPIALPGGGAIPYTHNAVSGLVAMNTTNAWRVFINVTGEAWLLSLLEARSQTTGTSQCQFRVTIDGTVIYQSGNISLAPSNQDYTPLLGAGAAEILAPCMAANTLVVEYYRASFVQNANMRYNYQAIRLA